MQARPVPNMSGHYIPKERLTAYERYELASFDEAERMALAMREAETVAPGPEDSQPKPQPLQPVASPPPTVPPIDEAVLAELRQQAYDEGRSAGFILGFEEGKAEGYASGDATVKAESERMAALARSFALSIDAGEAGLADSVLQLSLDLAAQVMCTSLQVKPELIIPVVREAIAALTNQHGHPNLLVNPDDAAVVRKFLGDPLSHTGWRIIEDPQIAKGGCRIESGGSEVDATLVTRWRRVIESLGQKTDWIDET